MKTPYQLCTTTNHDCFVYFDNGLPGNERFCVKVSIRKLPTEENQASIDAILKTHGEGSLHRRLDKHSSLEDVRLEYMKYVIVHHKGEISIYDLDNLTEVDIKSQKNFRLSKSSIKRHLLEKGKEKLTHGFCEHVGECSERTAKVQFNTSSHGLITLSLSTYADPDIRNGIDISVPVNLTKSTCWGALVTAINPKLLRVKKMRQLPPPLNSADMERRNDSDFWKEVDGFVERDGKMISTKMKVSRTKKDTVATQLLFKK